MFEAVELNRKITKEEYKQQLPELRAELLATQFALSKTNIPVIIIVSGIDASGRGEVVNVLNEWLDPRGVETISSVVSLTDEEKERPSYWQFWRNLPARKRIGIFFGGWYVDPILQSAYEQLDTVSFDEALTQICRFETMLVEDGALVLKFWLHLSKKEQRKRLKKLEKNVNTRRSVTAKDWKHAELYDSFIKAAERAIRHTDSGVAPWLLVEATNQRYRDIVVARHVLETLQKRIALFNAHQEICVKHSQSVKESSIIPFSQPTILDKIDLNQKVRSKTYTKMLATYQGKLHRLAWAAHQKKCSTVVVFEGWDASGKGGSIRRITQALDARLYRVISTAAPTDEEEAHHYLWRFWRHIPRAGMFTIYDRSWYGRVLVERVEEFAKEHEWKRAYLEINDFEEQLIQHGTVVIKFWIHISKEKQLQRFKEREQIAYKRHKITEEDWHNRSQWDEYAIAINDMVTRTSTDFAPWTLVAGNDKRFGRLQILKTVCDRLETVLGKV